MGVAIKTKSFTVQLDESEDSEVGVFSGYASVFGNVDSYGDVMVKGAFAKTLKSWEGRKIPVFYGHDMTDPRNNIGYVASAVEDDKGLFVRCVVDTEGESNGPVVYKLLKEGRIDRMSFGFFINDAYTKGDNTYIKSVDLLEVSVVPAPANGEAVISEVKSKKEAGVTSEELSELVVKPIIEHIDQKFNELVESIKVDEPEDEEDPRKDPKQDAKSVILSEIEGIFNGN